MKRNTRYLSFVWGKVLKTYEVGPYYIIKYQDGYELRERKKKVIRYHPYVKGQDTNHSYRTLEGALAGAMAYKYEGCNHRAEIYFLKMLGIKSR